MVFARRGDGGRVGGGEVVEAAHLAGGGPADTVNEGGEPLRGRGVREGLGHWVFPADPVADAIDDGTVTVLDCLDRCHPCAALPDLGVLCLILIILR